jgi:hypothetical protein
MEKFKFMIFLLKFSYVVRTLALVVNLTFWFYLGGFVFNDIPVPYNRCLYLKFSNNLSQWPNSWLHPIGQMYGHMHTTEAVSLTPHCRHQHYMTLTFIQGFVLQIRT